MDANFSAPQPTVKRDAFRWKQKIREAPKNRSEHINDSPSTDEWPRLGENFWKVRNSSGKLPSLKIRTLPPADENVPISVSIVAGQIPICYAPCGIRDTRARALYILRLTVLFPTRNGECEWRKRNQWSSSNGGNNVRPPARLRPGGHTLTVLRPMRETVNCRSFELNLHSFPRHTGSHLGGCLGTNSRQLPRTQHSIGIEPLTHVNGRIMLKSVARQHKTYNDLDF